MAGVLDTLLHMNIQNIRQKQKKFQIFLKRKENLNLKKKRLF